MRHFSRELLFLIVLCLFDCRTLFAAAYDDREDFQLPVQAEDGRLQAIRHDLVHFPSCCSFDATNTLHRL
jgi:hypothetical protein